MIEQKVLCGCITADVKMYCQQEFLQQIGMLTYPRMDVLFVDNSVTKDNCKRIRDYGYNCEWIPRKDKFVRQIMAESHDVLRQHALRHKYDYLFHFETDLFFTEESQHDIIEQLMLHDKQVCSAIYDMGDGVTRQLCVLLMDTYGGFARPYPVGKQDIIFVNGHIQRVYNAGIGACLIHKTVLDKFVFRIEPNEPSHPDMYFAKDIFEQGIEFYADTSLYLFHKNKDWGVYMIDYK